MSPAPRWYALDIVLAWASAAIITYGVIALDWSVFMVVLLAWFENLVVGVFNVARMLATGLRGTAGGLIAALLMAAFFTVHYGLFTSVHGLFVAVLFGSSELGGQPASGSIFTPLQLMLNYLLADRDGWLVIGAIVLLHASLFAQWFGKTRELPQPLNELMSAPYARIVVLHVTLIASGFFVQSLNAPAMGALLLVALKLAHDVIMLRRSHRADDELEAQKKMQRLLVTGRRDLRGRS